MNEYTNELKKEYYTTPEMEVVSFDQEDVILTSNEKAYPGEEDGIH